MRTGCIVASKFLSINSINGCISLTKNGEGTPSSRWEWAIAERDSRVPATVTDMASNHHPNGHWRKNLTSCKPPKSDGSLSITIS
jgi:hypothetical protein